MQILFIFLCWQTTTKKKSPFMLLIVEFSLQYRTFIVMTIPYSCINASSSCDLQLHSSITRLSGLSIRFTLCMTSFKPPLFKCLSYLIIFLIIFFVFFWKRGNLSGRACKINVNFFWSDKRPTADNWFSNAGPHRAASRESLRHKLNT